MGLGDLTSGVNMLPDNSMNQGIQSYLKDMGDIANQRAQIGENKIQEVQNLLNINLKGMQGSAMDEAVAAREKLYKTATQAAIRSHGRNIPWQDTKKLMAMKANLENMVALNKENQALYNKHWEQALRIKDPAQQQQAFINLENARKGNIQQVNDNLNNTNIVPSPTSSWSDVFKKVKIATNYNPKANLNAAKAQITAFYNSGDPQTVSVVDQYMKKYPGKTAEDAINYGATAAATMKSGGISPLAKSAFNANLKRNSGKTVVLPSADGNSVSVAGLLPKGVNLSVKGKDGKTYKGVVITGLSKSPDGTIMATVTHRISIAGIDSLNKQIRDDVVQAGVDAGLFKAKNVKGMSYQEIADLYPQNNTLSDIVSRDKFSMGTPKTNVDGVLVNEVTVPAAQYMNVLRKYINPDKVQWLKDAFNGKVVKTPPVNNNNPLNLPL